ncbi:hypothetical protein SLEP1_g26046 [Rubroshorea leprosula]|uniref:Uncharacterized protein n=1 Tax=Rubroshorea leprosula TaxID=152421 RepID=A0AAV5JKY1_9ROSI|nr:hypothetical protein SLEP1_g26046 [Rubroshorea leprosula]
MAEGKVTTMVLNVDLQCSKCYKKVKKLLCKFPGTHVPVAGNSNALCVIINCVAEALGAHVPVAGESNAFRVMGDPFATAGAVLEAVVEKINKTAQSCKY